MTHQLINSDTILDIPPTVAGCPYCGDKLSAVREGWAEAEDGSAEIRSASQRARVAALPVCPECGKVKLTTKAARAAGRCAKCKRRADVNLT